MSGVRTAIVVMAATAAAVAATACVPRRVQVPDRGFDTRVAEPAWRGQHPAVLLDEAHHNFHTAGGRYRPLARLLESDGYRLRRGREPFSDDLLEGYRALVIANARGVEDPAAPAFSGAECDAVERWVKAGGGLLLIADHDPYGPAAARLAERFGVEMRGGWIRDEARHDPETANPYFLLFTTSAGLAEAHPIVRGRGPSDAVERVLTFGGQGLLGPPRSTPLLLLSDTAERVADPRRPESEVTPAAGWSQGVALEVGRGKAVILGEAGMFSAQILRGPPARAFGVEKLYFGMNRDDTDNRQLALNTLRWLTGAL